jgi:hypothetical protein
MISRERGQTTLDFLVGVSVFLVTVGLVLTFVPGMLDPFTGDREVNALAADRAATDLTTDVLGNPREPYVLNESRVSAFFDPTTDVNDRLGLDTAVSVNATLTTDTQRWTVGPTPPDRSDSVIAAWRVVEVGGESGDLRVRVW